MIKKARKILVGKRGAKRTVAFNPIKKDIHGSHDLTEVFVSTNSFYEIKKLGDIVKVKEEGDIYKGVLVSSGETKLVARITGEAFLFPVSICSSDAKRKIEEAYVYINSHIKTEK